MHAAVWVVTNITNSKFDDAFRDGGKVGDMHLFHWPLPACQFTHYHTVVSLRMSVLGLVGTRKCSHSTSLCKQTIQACLSPSCVALQWTQCAFQQLITPLVPLPHGYDTVLLSQYAAIHEGI